MKGNCGDSIKEPGEFTDYVVKVAQSKCMVVCFWVQFKINFDYQKKPTHNIQAVELEWNGPFDVYQIEGIKNILP